MPKKNNILLHMRHLLMSVTLLWALMLNGQEVAAYTASAQATASQVATVPASENKTVVKQKVSLEATTSIVALNLQQALEPLPPIRFAAPVDEELTAAVALPPGIGIAGRLIATTIQPNAP